MHIQTTGSKAVTNSTRNMVCLWGRSGMGKTPTLLDLIPLFNDTYHCRYNVVWANPNDISLVIDINGFKLGINTMGDPGYGMKDQLIELATNQQCELIVCSSRTKGSTSWDVQHIAQDHSYNLIWTTNFHSDNSQDALNRLSAENLLQLLKQLIPKTCSLK